MAGEGKDVTLPTLDIEDFMGISFTTGPDGKIYQLPDQQFANLYWFRYDWFQKPELKEKFKAKYGYELGVPVNWSAYEDIAEFFTNDVKEIDGKAIYGHMDYGKKAPDLGWRFTDAWLSMAGAGDKGIPNGLPVDEWGIRVDGCRPGRRQRLPRRRRQRPGRQVRPAQVHGLAASLRTSRRPGHGLLPVPAESGQGQRGPADLLVHRLHRLHGREGHARGQRGRHAQVAHGSVPPRPVLGRRAEARLSGLRFLDSLESTPVDRRKAAWLFAQFCVAKTTSLKKPMSA
jgi:glycerol transport system substrate-binding protein